MAVETFLRIDKNMEVESLSTPNGYMIQAKGNDDNWKRISGMDKAIQIQIEDVGSRVFWQLAKS